MSKDFVNETKKDLDRLKVRITELKFFNRLNIIEKEVVDRLLNKIKTNLTWCDDFVGSAEVIEDTKKLLNDLYKIVNKKEEQMGKKRKHKKGNKMELYHDDWGYDQEWSGIKNVNDTPDFRDIKSVSRSSHIKDSTPRVTRFVNTPVIYILPEVYDKIRAWTELIKEEITGIGTVKDLGHADFLIDSMYIFDQNVSGVTCDASSPQALIEVFERMEANGHNPANARCWWHSHNSMGVSPSAKDDETGRNFCSKGFLISLISNHAGDLFSKMNLYYPIDMIIEEIPVLKYEPGMTEEFINERKEEIKKYVHTRSSYGFGYGYTKEPVKSSYTPPTLPLVSPLEEARNQLNEVHKPKSTTDEFIENNVRYVWNGREERWDMFCSLTGRAISDDEVQSFGAFNYNELDDTPKENFTGQYGA